MTWAQLAEQMMKLTIEEMRQEIAIVKDGVVYSVENLLINKNLIHDLKDGEPYLEVK